MKPKLVHFKPTTLAKIKKLARKLSRDSASAITSAEIIRRAVDAYLERK